jgi:hypothetical protein
MGVGMGLCASKKNIKKMATHSTTVTYQKPIGVVLPTTKLENMDINMTI